MNDIEHIIERINKLMAIAENEASSDNEAQMAYERAQKLINEYRIEDWKRDHTRADKPIVERSVKIRTDTLRHQQSRLASIIARNNECRIYLSEGRINGRLRFESVKFVGEKDDVEAAVLLFQSIDLYCTVHARIGYKDMIDRRAKEYYESSRKYVEEYYPYSTFPTLTEAKREMREDNPRGKWYYGYRYGFNQRLAERFDEIRRANLAAPTGRELATCKAARLDEYFDKNLKLGTGRCTRATGSIDGYRRGREDGGNVGLGLSEMNVGSRAMLTA